MTTRAQWAVRFQEAMDTGQLVVTPWEYDEIRDLLDQPGPADALATVFRGLVTGSMSLRLVVGEPPPPTRAEIARAADAQARMERRMGLAPPYPFRYVADEATRAMAWEMINRRIVASLSAPRNIMRITQV